MSKDVVIAGIIVTICVGLVVVAFKLPKKSETAAGSTDSSLTSVTDAPSPAPDSATPGLPSADTGAGAPTPYDGGFNFEPATAGGVAAHDPSASHHQNALPNSNHAATPDFGGPVTSLPPAIGSGGDFAPAHSESAPVMPQGEKIHVIAKGETLGDISLQYYGTSKNWKKIAELNKVDPNALRVGMKLTIPEIAAPVSAALAGNTGSGTESTQGASYTVKAGDSYYSIAKHELGSAARWKEIEKLNKIAPEDLRVGLTIKLPQKAEAAEAATTPVKSNESIPGMPASHDESSGKVHVVATGETLGDVSKKYYGTTTKWHDIVKANPGIEPESLKVGQKLNIPEIAGMSAAASSPSTGSPVSSVTETVTGVEYVIKPGDRLDDIAQRQLGKKTDAKKLLDANPGLDPRRLRIGQKIIIPGKSNGGASAQAGSTPSAESAFPTLPSAPSGPNAARPKATSSDSGFDPWLPPSTVPAANSTP